VDLYYGPYAYSVGGEFTAVTSPNVFNVNYSPLALVNVTDDNNQTQTGFETFCVQTEVDFTPYNWGNPTPYHYSTSLSSVGTPDNFALSEGTAWLYWQFATGQLAGYDYTDASTRITDAGILQAAIWDLQGGQSYGGFPNGGAGNPYYNDALTALGATALDEAATSSDNFGVDVLNMTDSGDGNAQNQLVYVGGGSGTHASPQIQPRPAGVLIHRLFSTPRRIIRRGVFVGSVCNWPVVTVRLAW
jgi:hypothetical protein